MIKFVNDTGETVFEMTDEDVRPQWVLCPTCGKKIITRWLVDCFREDIYRSDECQCKIRKVEGEN